MNGKIVIYDWQGDPVEVDHVDAAEMVEHNWYSYEKPDDAQLAINKNKHEEWKKSFLNADGTKKTDEELKDDQDERDHKERHEKIKAIEAAVDEDQKGKDKRDQLSDEGIAKAKADGMIAADAEAKGVPIATNPDDPQKFVVGPDGQKIEVK